MSSYSADDRLTGFDYGIKTGKGRAPLTEPTGRDVFNRPHSSPAMERALQRIEAHCWRPFAPVLKQKAA